MEDKVNKFNAEVDYLYKKYKLQAEQNINLGATKNQVTEKDATVFVQLFSVFSNKIMRLADNYELEISDVEQKQKINTITKIYMLKFKELFKFN
ncbi:MAG: hypothetical protein ACK4UK_03760 [Flavobacterium sp.]